MLRYDGHPGLARAIDGQRGLVTRRQALDAGMSANHVAGLVRTGVWVLVRRGVYMPADLWRALDPYDGRARSRARAAHLQMRAAHVLERLTARAAREDRQAAQ